jgi:hypothetical protein
LPAGRFHGAARIIEHLLRRAPGAAVLPHGLLREHWRETGAAHRGYVSRRRQTEPVTEAERGR